MALNANKIPATGQQFDRPEPLEPGTYPVRLVQIVSMGLHEQRPYKGEPKPPALELYLTYELLDEFMKDEDGNDIEDKPRWLSERIPFHSLESDLAKSTKRYFALDPKNEYKGDWSQLAGAPGMLTIVRSEPDKKGIVYNNITGLSGMREKDAAKAPELKNPPKIFDLDEPDMEVFGSFPKWLQDALKENLNYEGSVLEAAVNKTPVKDEAPKENEEPEENNEGEEDW